MEVARVTKSNQNRKSVIFLQRVLQLLFCSIVMQNIQIFYWFQPCLLLLVPSHSQTRNFLPEHLNIIIKQQLRGEGFPSLLPWLQADVFQQKQGILQQIIYAHQTSQKKACIRTCDTNNFTQSLTRKYHHTTTESLYRLCDEK